MAQLIFNMSTFVLTSRWTVGNSPEGLKMTTPTTHSLDQQLTLSGFPAGSTINSATLYVEREWGDTGARQDKINNSGWDRNLGSWRAEEDITGIVRANLNGTATLNFKWQANGTTAWGAGNKKAQLHYKLVRVTVDYTPGKSEAQLNKISVIANGNYTITATVMPHNAAYGHRLKWYVADHLESAIETNLAPGATTASVTIPESWCAYITNAAQGEARCSVETLNGSESLGANVYSFSVIVPDSIVPTVSLSLEMIDALQGTTLKGISKAKLSANAAGTYGSTIMSYQFNGAGYSGSGNPWTSGTINSTGTVTFSCTVTDSRGKTAQASISTNVADYAPPVLDAQAERADPDGTVSAQGTKIKVSAAFSAFNVSGNTITSAVASCRKKGSAAWGAEQTLQSGVDLILSCTAGVTEDYEIRIAIIDSAGGRAERVLQVPKGAQDLFYFLTDRAAIGCPAGDAGTLLIPGNWTTNATPQSEVYSQSFWIGGDENTYYPVVVLSSSVTVAGECVIYNLYRYFAAPAPFSWNNSHTHKGGLTLTFLWTGLASWSGNYNWHTVLKFSETYSRMVAGLDTSASDGIIFFLRGGGAEYKLSSSHKSRTWIRVFLGDFTDLTGRVFKPRTNLSQVAAEIQPKW